MKRLIIELISVEKKENKIFNTISVLVRNEAEIKSHLTLHEGNIRKHYFRNI